MPITRDREIQLFNRKPGHDKVYLVVAELQESGNTYALYVCWGKRSQFEEVIDNLQMRLSGYACLRLSGYACHEDCNRFMVELAAKKVRESGYTIFTDGVTPLSEWSMHASLEASIRFRVPPRPFLSSEELGSAILERPRTQLIPPGTLPSFGLRDDDLQPTPIVQEEPLPVEFKRVVDAFISVHDVIEAAGLSMNEFARVVGSDVTDDALNVMAIAMRGLKGKTKEQMFMNLHRVKTEAEKPKVRRRLIQF